MKNFSQRKGLKPVDEVIQTSSMSDTLRASLWNLLDAAIWSGGNFLRSQYGQPEIDLFSYSLWFHYFKLPVDLRPGDSHRQLACIRDHFFKCEWNEVYDFLEFVVSIRKEENPKLSEHLNIILEREGSAYRFVGTILADITSEQELDMLQKAIDDTQFAAVSAHLQQALALFADRVSPDYRNSIKESISAVEAMARIVAANPKATLPDALKSLERSGRLHAALKDGFIKLYSYTSDGDGIRHAMLEESNLTAADAQFFLLSCTSFSNYLKAQLASKNGV